MSLNGNKILFILFFLFAGCFRQALDGNRNDRDIRISNPYKGTVAVPFQLINNLVVIDVRINNSDTLKFVLDTGAGRTIITELAPGQGFEIQYKGDIQLNGLGNSGPIPALISEGNQMFIKGVEGENQIIVFLLEGVFNLSTFMGTQVNGLIGYDIFKNFIVEINYQKERLYFHDPDAFSESYESKKQDGEWTYVPLVLDKNKLYMDISIKQSDGSVISSRLLIDSGASHTLFLYPDTSSDIKIPANTVYSFLGMGLSGEIYGEIGRAKKIQVENIELIDPIVSYPQLDGIKQALAIGERNGSIGADFLKRFDVIFNYGEPSMLIKPNGNFNKEFTYNTSGMEITTPLVNLPYYVVSKVREGSPADEAGILEGDVLYEVNRKKIYEFSLNELLNMFHSNESKVINLYVKRDSGVYRIDLELEDKTKHDDES